MLFWKSLRICFFHIYQIYVSGMSLQTCSFSMFVHIVCLRENTVHYWAKFASLFGRTSLTFVVHSRLGIVMPVLSRYMRREHLVILKKKKKRAFSMTLWTFDSFCSSCSNFVTLNSSILLTVVTAYGLNQSGLHNNIWPLFVTEMYANPGRLNYTNCNTQTSITCLKR